MEVWRADVIEGRRPEVLSGRNVFFALALHAAFFLVLWTVAVLQGLFTPKETVVPIDLTVVVNENLDGNDAEPPPLQDPEPPPPPPPPRPRPKPVEKRPDPQKALEQIVTNVVKTTKAKPERQTPPVKPKEPPKAADSSKEKPPKETIEDRIKRIRDSAVKNTKPVKIKVNAPSGNGRTAHQTLSPEEIRRRLDAGYKPGRTEQIATSDLQLGVSLVQMALNEKWDQMSPKVGASGTVLLSCRFNSAGGLTSVQIARSCGDRLSDTAALSVARAVTHIRNLPTGFLKKFSKETLTIKYQVIGM